MKVTHAELLSWHLTLKGRCLGTVVLHGEAGESVQLKCDVPCDGHVGRRALNAALAHDAMRQLHRMPEYRNMPPETAQYALPQGRKHRLVQLSAM